MTTNTSNQKKFSGNKRIIALVLAIVLILSALFIFSVGYFRVMYKPFKIALNAMAPTLSPEDRIVTRIMTNDSAIKRGDIIVFISDEKRNLIKRVVGLPGETIELKEGKLFIDQKEIKEDYIKFKDIIGSGPEKIKDGQFFVLGDNRSNSRDSRIFGPIKKGDIVGKVIFRYYPFDSLGTLQ